MVSTADIESRNRLQTINSSIKHRFNLIIQLLPLLPVWQKWQQLSANGFTYSPENVVSDLDPATPHKLALSLRQPMAAYRSLRMYCVNLYMLIIHTFLLRHPHLLTVATASNRHASTSSLPKKKTAASRLQSAICL